MDIQKGDGLTLHGTVVSSRIDEGLKKDDGKPWKARVNFLSSGTRVFGYRESGLDPAVETQPLEVGSRISVEVDYAKTEGGITSVSGPVVKTVNGSSDVGVSSAKTKS